MYTTKDLIKSIEDGKYDSVANELYSCGDAGRVRCRDRFKKIVSGFTHAFGDASGDNKAEHQPTLFSAPGRAELIGNHVDHQRGQVLTATLTKDILACAAPNGSDHIRIISAGFDEINVNVTDTEIKPGEYTTAAALVRGVVNGIKEYGFKVNGFNAYMESDIPVGGGLSSSAAFELMIATIINEFSCQSSLTGLKLAAIAMLAENKYFGKSCGMMDQTACVSGGISHIDFKANVTKGVTFTETEEPLCERIDINLEKEGIALCMIDTGSEHSALSEDFEAIPREMKAAAAVLGGEVLGDIDEKLFLKNAALVREKAGDRAFLRSIHLYDECRRVRRGADALRQGDIKTFLKMANESGRSSFMYLQNVDTYRDVTRQPVATVLCLAQRLLKGKGACRVHGGGFAGSVIAFVPVEMKEEFKTNMDALLGYNACSYLKIRGKTGVCRLG